jgi:hypothetical protein
MQSTEVIILAIGLTLTIPMLVLWVKAILWTGRDARRRGFRHAGWIQLLTVLQFPWPWLIYYLVVRDMDRRAAPQRA